ncbi:MAG: ATP-grasp domain-containing protein [Acidobacteriota bacterium]|nr:ATP-grasp domain-containing protein [Acidobacteriota bacterium]
MRLLLVAATTGYQTRAFAEAARRLDIEPILATDRCHILDDPWGDRAIPVRFDDPEAAAELLAGETFDGVVAVADRPTEIAALTAERLGIPYHPPAAVRACRDKNAARQRFQSAGLLTPEFSRFPLTGIPDYNRFPCVLKPLGLSASRGVIRANNLAQFQTGFTRIRELLARPDIVALHEDWNRYIQVESFIEGSEFAIEGLVTNGELQVLAIFDKPDPLNGPYFEETLYISPSRESRETQRAMIETTQTAVRALGLTHGPIHAEMRVNSQGVWMLEVGARPIGGLCARTLRFDGGVSLEEIIIRHAVGEDVRGAELMDAASGVMMIPIPKAGIYEGAEGVEEARAVPGIAEVIVTAKQGQKMERLPEAASYLGFIFAKAETPDEVEQALRTAHARLRFEIATSLRLMR